MKHFKINLQVDLDKEIGADQLSDISSEIIEVIEKHGSCGGGFTPVDENGKELE